MSNKKYPSQKWKLNAPLAEEVRDFLIKKGGVEDKDIKSKYEAWRVKFSDSTFTYYHSGTLFSTATNDIAVKNICQIINNLTGDRYSAPTKDYLIGLDETGKGEVLGPAILVGAFSPKKIYPKVEKIVGVADSKSKRTMAYWDEIQKRLDTLKQDGFTFILDKIPPEHIDKFNINKIMDVVYQRILCNLTKKVDISKVRIALDDYGVGDALKDYLSHLKAAGADVIVAQKADEKYLEAKVASLIAKRERERVMEAIRKSEEFKVKNCPIGSGNAADEKTIKWLKAWKASGKPWPWFVKKSFKTIRDIDGKNERVKKENPPIRKDLLSDEFTAEAEAGSLFITNLSVVCPSFGSIRKTSLITIEEGQTMGRCVYCKSPINDLNHTLRYYCGSLLPDSNIILRGLLSSDLQHSKFFEGFTILIHPLVKRECRSLAGSRELERLAELADYGMIKLLDLAAESQVKESIILAKDEQFKETALKYNAIIVSDDIAIIKSAQKNNLFSLYA